MRPLDPHLVDHAVELYRAGKAIPQIATELSIGASTLSRKLRAAGVEARSPRLSVPSEEIVAKYRAGESVLSLAQTYGVSRPVILRRLHEQGVDLRGQSEAMSARMASMTPEERSHQVEAAHAAVRGRVVPDEERAKTALTREANPPAMSSHEAILAAWLDERDIAYTREKAVGRYNVDFAAEPVAVEVLGGNWHSSRAHTALHGRRTPHILDAGWALAFVWATANHPLTEAVADYLGAYVDEARRNPAVVGEYRVIRGDAELLARGRREDYERTGIPSPRHGLDAIGGD